MEIRGVALLDKKTKNLIKRLKPGQIAVIDHQDIDEVAARGLIEKKVKAVINCAQSISGKYPNIGPLLLVQNGISLIDEAPRKLFDVLNEGDFLIIREGKIYRNDEFLGEGTVLDVEKIKAKMEATKENLGETMLAFIENTLHYARKETGLILGQYPPPPINTDFRGRHALIVVRGHNYQEDLKAIRIYINEVKPVLIGVDGGADALREAGYCPDIIIGDMDSVSDETLKCGAEIIVHAYPNGEAPGLKRLHELGLNAKIYPAPGTSEDIAMLLAYEKGAELIVAVGTHSNLFDFLEKGRKGMGSTFLVRLLVGAKLVDAKGVNKLYKSRLKARYLLHLIVAALIPVVIILAVSPVTRNLFRVLLIQLKLLFGI
ncbi:hypothetical protein ciss_15760 [Carboxydothermus islandicus]|uniref:Uncharacterized protein n=1 Tax=Carboxydothermus islandicus TaxID=661089 RepID=A0A1L8D3A0_9THEO|nr:putative cytokinetic ring protein SteA [Carboxydothermus islandicus]GAV25643.1 hypothetical protein ciss_15760 [Carboxydothermus islandicus]